MFKAHRGYTLVEMLMATVLTLMMMGAVTQLFESVGKGITRSRALLEVSDRLRLTATRLQLDLAGFTTTMEPPREPAKNEGYFEYTEGPIGPIVRPEAVYRNVDIAVANNSDRANADTTVIDNDDILMFTVHSNEPFVGRYRQPYRNSYNQVTSYVNTSVQSHDAEVAWFVRGRTLYRRVLLIVPNLDLGDKNSLTGFYAYNDVSMRAIYDDHGDLVPWANSLSDLTRPECRFAHQPRHFDSAATPAELAPAAAAVSRFPYHPHFGAYWDLLSQGTGTPSAPNVPGILTNTGAPSGGIGGSRAWRALGLPTLRECASANWPAGQRLPNIGLSRRGAIDLWTNPHFWNEIDPDTGTILYDSNAVRYDDNQTRINEDVILSNVIGFDVKAWDPGAPIISVLPTAASETNQPANILMPGDPGYLLAVAAMGGIYNGIEYRRVASGAYVDLNYLAPLGPSGGLRYPNPNGATGLFSGAGHWRSGTRGVEPFAKTYLYDAFNRGADVIDPNTQWIARDRDRDSVYDTWSKHYEQDGVIQFPVNLGLLDVSNSANIFQPGDHRVGDLGTNGIDDNVPDKDATSSTPAWIPGSGAIDDDDELDTRPPYSGTLRGVQVTIRVYEPSTNQIRQRTIRQNFGQ